MTKPPKPTAPNAPPKVEAPKVDHVANCEKAIAEVTAKICAEMFVDTIEEARKLMAASPQEHHVLELRDERGELEFLNKRLAQLKAKSDAVAA